jgi:hypothetical protein
VSNTITVRVDGSDISLDIEADTSMLDLSDDMDSIAATIAWYGTVLAAAQGFAETLELNAKIWRAQFLDTLLAGDAKVAEWKAKAAAEAHPLYRKHHEATIAAWQVVTRLEHACRALQVKADILRSKGANIRAEMSATGMNVTVPRETTKSTRGPDREAVRQGMSKKRPADDDGD